jgi:uncharacterized protein (TIGR03083 family)
MAGVEDQLSELERSIDGFVEPLKALGDDRFREPLGRWTLRDVVAHLIGWNRYTVRGCRELQEGRLPFYDLDPGENYARINAVLVREVSADTKIDLLRDLRSSSSELADYLRRLAPEDWERDYGVRHLGKTVTVRNSVDELIEDYQHHRRQIVEWAATLRD